MVRAGFRRRYSGAMFVQATDEIGGMVVWLFTGRINSDEDFQAYCDSIQRLSSIDVDTLRFAVLIVDAGNPIPGARWRKEIAEVSRDVGANTVFILVGSPIVRGVATAINWIRRPIYTLRTAATFTDAVLVAEELAGKPLPALRRLHEQVRVRVRDVA